MTKNKKGKGFDEPDWLPNPEDERQDDDACDEEGCDTDPDKIMQRKIVKGIKEGMKREREQEAQRQAEEMRKTVKKWEAESLMQKELDRPFLHGKQSEDLTYNQLSEAIRAASYVLELSDSRSAVKEDFKPETKEKLNNMKRALVKLEMDARKGKSENTAAEIGFHISDSEDLLTELDELYAPVVTQLMTILNRLSADTPKESVDYIVNDAQDHLREIFEAMLEMGKIYQNEIRMHFEVFKEAGLDMEDGKVSDINELVNSSARFPEGKQNVNIYDRTMQIYEEINYGLRAENSTEQAEENAQLMIELVDTHVKLISERAATEISILTYKSVSDFHPLGKTHAERLTSTICMLGSAIRLCDTLKKQKEIIRIMLDK